MLSFTDSGCRLPLDLIDLIIYEVAEDEYDIVSLYRCTRVCKDFAAICQRYLFHSISLSDSVTIWDPTPSTLTRRFKSVLDKNPGLARHVREVNYVNKEDCKSTVPVLRRLRYVHTFSLEFEDTTADEQNWDTMLKSLRISICYFIQANNIVDLHLRGIANIPLIIFFHMPHLKDLALSNISISDSAPTPINFRKPESNIQLVSLTVRSGFRTLAGLQKLLDATWHESEPLLDLRNLEEFSYHYATAEYLPLIGTILASSDCLERIDVYGYELNWLGHLAPNLTAGSLRTLTTLELLFEIEFGDDPYQNVIHELAQISGRNVLETLDMTISVYTNGQCTTDMQIWSQLDVVLSPKDAFPYLRHIEVLLITNSYSCDYTQLHDSLGDIIDLGFPRLLGERPEVEFSFTLEENEI